MKDISTSINKVDNEEKISGSALYVADMEMNGMLYAMTKRSTIACGWIKHIYIPPMPEGYYIVDYRDIPGPNVVKVIKDDWPIFAEKMVNYIGEPILLVVGPKKEEVIRILNNIVVNYIEKEPNFEWTNKAIHYAFDKGKGSRIFDEADHLITETYETGYQEQAYIEPQGFLGYPEHGKITLVGSVQCPYYVKNAVVYALDTLPKNVRVIQATVGGAFGGKEEFPSLIGCQLAVAVNKIQKPIQLIYERHEDMTVTTKRHPSKTVFEAAIKGNEIIGLRAYVGIDAGATIGLSGVVLSRALLAVSGVYTFDHLSVSGDVFITNTVPNGAFRGFGAPQMFFAIEMFIDHVAEELGVDAYLFRRRYLAKQGDLTSTSGIFRDPVLMPRMIKKAMDVSGYTRKRKLFKQSQSLKGIGMSWFFHGCGFTGSGEKDKIKAKVKLKKISDGTVYILVAAVDMGQGVRTTFRKLVSHLLEISLDKVVFDLPDTDYVPDSGPTVASRTMMIVGGLLARAAEKMKRRFHEPELTIVKQYQQPKEIVYDEEAFKGDAYPAYSWGVQVVEVEVDPVTYEVKVNHTWSVYDIGKAIDERIVMGQADGGIVQGMGYGYLEVMDHQSGKIRQSNMTDYIIPTAKDTGKMETYLFENPYAYGPYGAKGVGELTLIGGAPAIAKAIEHAIGKRVTKLPVSPEYIMELMNHDED